jgi:hypothetical protein
MSRKKIYLKVFRTEKEAKKIAIRHGFIKSGLTPMEKEWELFHWCWCLF